MGQQMDRMEQRMNERLAFMEDRLGRQRSWLPLWGGSGSGDGNAS